MIIDLGKLKLEMRRPCATCPFRRDVDPLMHTDEISPTRIRQMAPDLSRIPWACHSTTDRTPEGRERDVETTQHCAGLRIVLEKQQTPHSVVEFLKAINECTVVEVDLDTPTYDSLNEMLVAYSDALAGVGS